MERIGQRQPTVCINFHLQLSLTLQNLPFRLILPLHLNHVCKYVYIRLCHAVGKIKYTPQIKSTLSGAKFHEPEAALQTIQSKTLSSPGREVRLRKYW